MSDSDLALFKQSLPRIINQPGGNAAIIQTMRAIAEYDAAGAGIVQLLRAGEIDRAEAFKRLQSRPNPLEGLRVPAGGDTAGGATTTAPAGGVRTFNPATGKLE
jgi:flagellar protein FlgJ